MTQNINAQQWLDSKYPLDKVCDRNSDKENKGKKCEEITVLDISKGNLGKHFYSNKNGDKILVGSLKLERFIKLRKLIISSHELTELDVSDCPNLEELQCQNNQIDILNVNNCSNLEKIDCSGNNLKELDLSSCSSLKEVDINSCYKLISDTSNKIKSQLFYDNKEGKLMAKLAKDSGSIITVAKDNDIRNILIIGMTGSGKSALSNTLTNNSDSNEFGEKNCGVSATKNFHSVELEWKGKKYRIIDNIGFGDTANISEKDILFEIGKGIYVAKEGLNQVLFVFKDRFSKEQIGAFNLFKDFIDETGITKFTTLVRTNFEEFESTEKCREDRDSLLNQTKILSEIINSCNNIIHANNPPISTINEGDSERVKRNNEYQRSISNERRLKSKEIVLNHLVENCSKIYKLKEWDSIYNTVDNYIKRKRELEQNNSPNKNEELKKEKNDLLRKVDKSIEGNFGISIANSPLNFNIGFKKTNYQEEYKSNIEVISKKI